MQDSKRKYERRPCDLPAMLYHPETGDVVCRIRDFCAGGMLLELPHALEISDRNQPVQISTTLKSRELRLEAVAAHIQDTRIGASFLKEADPEVLQMLVSATSPAERYASTQTARAPDAQRTRILAELEQGIITNVCALLDAHARSLHEEFADRLQTTYGSEERHGLDTAIMGLGKSNHKITEETVEKLIAWLKQVAEGEKIVLAPKQQRSSGLSLIDDTAFEQWLVVSTVTTRAEESFADLLSPIGAALGYLFGISIPNKNIPVGPAAICQAYYEAAEQYMVDGRAARAVFEIFEKSVVQRLGNYLAGVLRLLEAAGLVKAARNNRPEPRKPEQTPAKTQRGTEPSLNFSANQAPDPQAADTGQIPTAAAPQHSAMPGSFTAADFAPYSYPGTGKPMSHLARSLGALKRPFAAQPVSHGIADDQLVDLLDTLPADEVNSAPYLGDFLHKRLEASNQSGLDADQLAYSNLVGQIFTQISTDQRIPQSLSDTLKSLQLPYLKLSLKEPDALADRNHPARIALEQLSGLLVEQDDLSPGLQHAVELSCERLVREFPEQPEVFEEISEELAEIRNSDEQNKRRNQERVIATQNGQQKIINTRLLISDQLLEMRDESNCMPNIIRSMLEQFWATRLVNLHLQEGPDSDRLLDELEIIRGLCAFLRDLRNGSATPDAAENCRKMLSRLQGFLSETHNYDAEIPRLLMLLDQVQASPDSAPEALEPVVVDTLFKHEDRVRRSREIAADLNNPWVRKIRSMEDGQHIVIAPEGETPRPVMPAWHAPDWTRLVFVNQKGMHVTEAFTCDMVEYLRDGSWYFDVRRSKSSVDEAILDVMQDVAGDLSSQTRVDELTGLQNRRVLETKLEQVLRSERRRQSGYCYLLINIDRFRLYNLDYGHQAGDQLLSAIGMVIKQEAPRESLYARIGSDEFCLLLANETAEQAQQIGSALIESVAHLHEAGGRDDAATISVGIFVIDGETISLDQVFRSSQAACAQCKLAGGNRVQLFDETCADASDKERREENWSHVVDSVLEAKNLQLFHQPICAIDKEDLHRHSEILLRIISEDKEVSTFDFIVAAESSGRIQEVDRWVLANTLSWMEGHPDELEKLGGVAVNLSAASLGDERFLEFIIASLRLSRVNPEHICFELTETATVTSMERMRMFIYTLKGLGCKFALDDFGSGMASYSYLKNLPVDYLKIDGIFIKDLKNNPADGALVSSITDFASFMGIRTIAEFVEDQETVEMLSEIGVNYVQGYHLGKPVALPGTDAVH